MKDTDWPVVVFKILSYLYNRLQEGALPLYADLSAAALGINERYWQTILEGLCNVHYISEVSSLFEARKTAAVQLNPDPFQQTAIRTQITFRGVNWLHNSELMQEAQAYVEGK